MCVLKGDGIHTIILWDLRVQLGRLFAAFRLCRHAIKFNFPRAAAVRLSCRPRSVLPRRARATPLTPLPLSPPPARHSPSLGAAFAPFFSQIHMTASFLLFPPYQRRYLRHPSLKVILMEANHLRGRSDEVVGSVMAAAKVIVSLIEVAQCDIIPSWRTYFSASLPRGRWGYE